MIDDPAAAGPPSPAERRLVQLLGAVRAEAPAPSTALAGRIARAARWQQTLRSGLRIGGWIAGAASGALSLLTGRRPR